MFHRFYVPLLLLCGLTWPAGHATAQDTGVSRDSAAIVALEIEMSRLLVLGALPEYERHLAPDYARTTHQGELQMRDRALDAWRERGPAQAMIPTEMWVRVYGDAAILTALVVGESGGAGLRITKTFVRVDGTWLLAALHSSRPTGSD